MACRRYLSISVTRETIVLLGDARKRLPSPTTSCMASHPVEERCPTSAPVFYEKDTCKRVSECVVLWNRADLCFVVKCYLWDRNRSTGFGKKKTRRARHLAISSSVYCYQ
ncbi:unnamed protein product [Ectocarpus sp. 6 AP-2014]